MEKNHENEETELKKREALRLSNEESNKLTRDCIRTALLYLMGDISYEKITVTQIIKRSGVSRAGFYRNYASKDDVLNEILEDQYDKIRRTEENGQLAEDPEKWFTQFFQSLMDNQNYLYLLMNARQPVPMGPGKRPGDMFYDASLPPRERYRKVVYETAIPFLLVQWYSHGMQESPEEMGKICAEIYRTLS